VKTHPATFRAYSAELACAFAVQLGFMSNPNACAAAACAADTRWPTTTSGVDYKPELRYCAPQSANTSEKRAVPLA
jgi:hypothetical protein